MLAEPQGRKSGQRGMSRWPEVCLAVLGLVALGYCAFASVEARLARRDGKVFAGPLQQQVVEAAIASDGVLGTIRIPQLGLTAPITSGIGSIELIRGVGHIPGTATAGGLGTMGLAGHRDTFFRALKEIQPGMLVNVSGSDGSYTYQVDSTEIVTPDKVSVLATRSEPSLVLVTCYPFHYIGAAPRRFIVHAKLLSLVPDENEQGNGRP